MAPAKLTRLAGIRAQVTREQHQLAVHRLTALGPGSPTVPHPADPAQEALEWWIMLRCAWPAEPVVAPFGFERVSPTPDGLHIEPAATPAYRRWFVSTVLPSAGPDGEVTGIPGLRTDRDRTGAPVLSLAGTTASVVLRGIPAQQWRTLTADFEDELRSAGHFPLWNTGPATTEEMRNLTWFDPATAGPRPHWLGSGLLRRVGVFTAAGVPALVTGWPTAGTIADCWKFDLEFIPGHVPDHGRLAALLADPAVGLAMRVRGHECRESGASRCRLRLVAADGRPGEVELLFRHTDEAVINAWETRWPKEFALIRQAGRQAEPQH
ncbi:hypothetical protein [Streptomyces sp. NRRL S-350]|uniref:hypothetical protein n=1 Tax=Streptomyces sp. NRRL S-350 TaxID=1463902 RepID=UPI0004BF45C7|nr:hypothetical protein [Streptomyces sp. NRRL S-350]